MGYYLGKNNPGDLASALTGAYNLSSPTPINTQSPPPPGGNPGVPPAPPAPPPGPTTPPVPPSVPPAKAACWLECFGKGYREWTPQMIACVDECVGKGGGDCVSGKACWSKMDCPGGDCIGSSLDPGNKKQGTCKCSAPQTCTTTADCPTGFYCNGGKCERLVSCTTDANCPSGQKCVNGTCEGGTTTGCPEGSGAAYAKNPAACPCGVGYATLTRKCASGYTLVTAHRTKEDWGASDIPYKEGATGTCECTQAIADWKENKGGTLGEYTYPPEMQALMDLLLSRGKDLMGMPTGYSQEAQDKMFGRGFENVRAGEAGARTGMEQGLSRQGMLGTGAGQGMLNDLSWQTEGNVANLARDLFVGNETKKKQDLLDYTGAAQGILGSGMGFEQLLEAINASRRGEGSAAMQALLAWYMGQA